MPSSSHNRGAVACLLLVLLVGCGPAPPVELLPFECELGLLTPDDEWVDVEASGGTQAELIFGFQGFLWVDAAIRGDDDCPEVADVAARVSIDGFDPFGRSVPDVRFSDSGEGLQSETVPVRLDNSEGPSLYAGHAAELVVRVTGATHEATCQATVLLVDDDPCIDADGEPICPGDDDDSAEGGR